MQTNLLLHPIGGSLPARVLSTVDCPIPFPAAFSSPQSMVWEGCVSGSWTQASRLEWAVPCYCGKGSGQKAVKLTPFAQPWWRLVERGWAQLWFGYVALIPLPSPTSPLLTHLYLVYTE